MLKWISNKTYLPPWDWDRVATEGPSVDYKSKYLTPCVDRIFSQRYMRGLKV